MVKAMMNDQSQSSVAALRAKSFRGHIYGLDGVRGLAILVVLFHNVGYFEEPADSFAIKILVCFRLAGKLTQYLSPSSLPKAHSDSTTHSVRMIVCRISGWAFAMTCVSFRRAV